MSDNLKLTRSWREIALEAVGTGDSPQLHILLLELLDAINRQVLKRGPTPALGTRLTDGDAGHALSTGI